MKGVCERERVRAVLEERHLKMSDNKAISRQCEEERAEIYVGVMPNAKQRQEALLRAVDATEHLEEAFSE